MSQTRRILMPVKKPEEIKSPQNALQEAIDRALRPEKSPLQMRADEYYEKALASTYSVKRYEHLDDSLIIFTYSDFSITKIKGPYPNGSFKVHDFHNVALDKSGTMKVRTVADELNEKWAEQADEALTENYLNVLDRFKATCYHY